MPLKKTIRPVIAAWLALFPLCASAADFAPPAIGPVAFRRDQLPLAAWTMAGLSRNLVTIAQALPGESAAQRQAAARALALAIALDPANDGPHKLLAIYQIGRPTPDADASRLAESQARVWQLIAWLETPEAGPQGRALAFCLQDVMVVADPKHPLAEALLEAGDKGAWAGWVPDIHAYESGEIAATPRFVGKAAARSEILLPKASVQTVFRQRAGTGLPARWAYASAPLQMEAFRSPEGGDPRFSIFIGPESPAEPLMTSARTVRRLLEKQFGELPARMSVRIYGSELMRALEEGRVPEVSAAAAVLASAAITGHKPQGLIIGRLDQSGAVKQPARFWDQLQALGKGNGGRVVLPAAAADWLPALIVMENPGFFMEHEILLASDFQQLLDLSSKSGEGAVADAAAKFSEIRARAEGQDLRAYLANRFVRQRLEELVKAAPFHASAAMLLLQGSTSRPRELSRPVLASELRRSIEPMDWIGHLAYLDASSKESGELGTVYKSCRLSVDKLESYIAKADQDLWESSREATAALWKVSRAVNARGASPSAIQSAMADFTRLYRNASEQLDRAANGDAP